MPANLLAQEPPAPPATVDPYTAPPPTMPPPGAIPMTPILAAPLPPPGPGDVAFVQRSAAENYRGQWRGARVMNGFGGVLSLLSVGLTLSNVIYVAAAHYPPSVSDLTKVPSPSDPAQALSYVSSTTSAFAFGLAAGSLGWRHHILRKLDADTGRGLFWGGAITGLVGIAAIASSYIVGFASVANTRDQSIAVLSTSLGGSAICSVATAMFAKDATNVQEAWRNLTTF
ncbi:MAG TPA: hypothetical protein VGL86_00990 [Polyangia bacterium]